jgi:hypothetical protein
MADAADYLGIPNLIMVVYGGKPEPPFDDCADGMRSLKRVVWSIIGDAGSKRNDESSDLEAVIDLSRRFPNVTGAIMDDLFHEIDDAGLFSRRSVDELAEFQSRLQAAPRPLDLWTVLYDHDLSHPIRPYIERCDVVTYWTWHAMDIAGLEESFARAESAVPESRKVLGCYMWDYGTNTPMPVEIMQRQCELGLKWLEEGRIEGMIFLASCICDIGLEAVEWTKGWISEVSDRPITSNLPEQNGETNA